MLIFIKLGIIVLKINYTAIQSRFGEIIFKNLVTKYLVTRFLKIIYSLQMLLLIQQLLLLKKLQLLL